MRIMIWWTHLLKVKVLSEILKMIKLNEANKAISLSDLSKIEENLGSKLPNDYKKFLSFSNGGVPVNNIFPVPSDGDAVLNEFFPIELTKSFFDDFVIHLDKTYLKIADDASGNLVLMSIDDSRSEIYYSDLERNDRSLTKLSNSFSDFLASFQSEDQSLESIRKENPEVVESFLEKLERFERESGIRK